MAKSKHVFIYDGLGTEPLSTDDLENLFTTSTTIFPKKPDVTRWNSPFNMDGLENPVFVVPGGSTRSIGEKLLPQMNQIKLHFQNNYSYVGVGAGACLGVHDTDLFLTFCRPGSRGKYEPAEYLCSTKQHLRSSFDIVHSYKGFGGFYPDNSYLDYTPVPKKHMPFCVNITYTSNLQKLSQLYLSSPAFVRLDPEKTDDTEVIAYYADSQKFTLFGSQKNYSHPLAAIIRNRPKTNQGGTLLSATHFETCVAGSKLLSFFSKEGNGNAKLQDEDLNLLEKQKTNTRAEIEAILHETLHY